MFSGYEIILKFKDNFCVFLYQQKHLQSSLNRQDCSFDFFLSIFTQSHLLLISRQVSSADVKVE